MDVLLGLAEGLPSGAYTGAGIERYLRRVLAEPGRTDDFRKLPCELYITATDLDTCERVRVRSGGLGQGADLDGPCARRERYRWFTRPCASRSAKLIDGGIVSTTNLDIAIEAGAKFVVVINPIVPFVNDFATTVRTLRGTRRRRVSDMGFPRSATRRSSSSPTSACTSWPRAGSSATPESTSFSSSRSRRMN